MNSQQQVDIKRYTSRFSTVGKASQFHCKHTARHLPKHKTYSSLPRCLEEKLPLYKANDASAFFGEDTRVRRAPGNISQIRSATRRYWSSTAQATKIQILNAISGMSRMKHGTLPKTNSSPLKIGLPKGNSSPTTILQGTY